MKTYLTLKDAVAEYNIKPEKLQDLIDQGDVKTALLDGNDSQLIVSKDDIKAYVAERDITREQFEHLDGVEIGVNEAAIKYRFSSGTLSRWVQEGKIRLIRQEGNYKKLINEADVAYARALADAKGLCPGRSLF